MGALALSPHRFPEARKEIVFAYDKVPFFRKHLDAAGLHPDVFTHPESLHQLPATSKSDYRRNFPAGVLARGQSLSAPGVIQVKSSGTEAERLTTPARSITFARRLMTCLSVNPHFAFMLKTRPLRSVRFAAPNCSDVECANPHSTYEDRLLPDGTLVLPVYHDLLTTPPTLMDVAMKDLLRHAPHFLYADPTHLAHLGHHCGLQRPELPGLQAIALGFSLCTRQARHDIAAWWGPSVPIAEVVAMSEFGWLAMTCPQGALHLNIDSYYLELEAPDTACAEAGLQELIVTSLADDLAPHIRYRTGDVYRLLKGCACGHRFPVVRAEGRRKNLLDLDVGGGLLTPRELDDVVGNIAGVQLYQLEQEAPGTFSFRYIPTIGAVPSTATIEETLHGQWPGIQLRIEEVRYIPAERSGKFMTCRRRE